MEPPPFSPVPTPASTSWTFYDCNDHPALRTVVPTVLRGAIVNGTYGIHNNLYIEPLLLTIFSSINYGPP